MRKNFLNVSVLVLTLGLAGCAGTDRFVENPGLRVTDGTPAQEALRVLLSGGASPVQVTFCDAASDTGDCLAEGGGLAASGVGGLFLPLAMSVDGMDITKAEPTATGLDLTLALDAEVNGIPPLCGEVVGKLDLAEGDRATIRLSNFYCNWALIGNVITDVRLSIETIDPVGKSFSGYYSITLVGTGNASGSGYFRAVTS